MVPSLASEIIQPYVEAIEDIEKQGPRGDVVAWLLRRSRAHEALGNVCLRIGHWREAFTQMVFAATVCTKGYDACWLDCDEGYLLVRPLRSRFFYLYDRCQSLKEEYPLLRGNTKQSDLEEAFAKVTHMEQLWAEEFNTGLETLRAWNFGKTGSQNTPSKVSNLEARDWRVPVYFSVTG